MQRYSTERQRFSQFWFDYKETAANKYKANGQVHELDVLACIFNISKQLVAPSLILQKSLSCRVQQNLFQCDITIYNQATTQICPLTEFFIYLLSKSVKVPDCPLFNSLDYYI